MDERAFKTIIDYLERVPSLQKPISFGGDDGLWWIKFSLDIKHSLAWHVVQELGHVINYLSLNERLPTIFYPVSPPPYMNGGPDEFLSWVIETTDKEFKPGTLAKWLEGRLPRPVDDLAEWSED
ncbi:MAG: hypothetical protein R8G66_29740 [Cytophagales bacterium]|nr:hypothetical protein [Cytophagales bacterium]